MWSMLPRVEGCNGCMIAYHRLYLNTFGIWQKQLNSTWPLNGLLHRCIHLYFIRWFTFAHLKEGHSFNSFIGSRDKETTCSTL